MALNLQQYIAQMMRQQQGAGRTPGALTPQPGSNESSLVGDRQLPTSNRTIKDLGRGYYDVSYGGNSVGVLRPGGSNGRFVGNGAPIARPLAQPIQQAGPQQLGGQPGMQLGGQQSGPPRQYAPNPFQGQMAQADMIRNRPIKTAQMAPQQGGLQGFR